jgi:hypothetical protein
MEDEEWNNGFDNKLGRFLDSGMSEKAAINSSRIFNLGASGVS